MALSFDIKHQTVTGNKRLTVTDVTFDNTYAEGGMTISANSVGLNKIESAQAGAATTGQVFSWDQANAKMLVLTVDTTGEPLGEVTTTGANNVVATVWSFGT